MRIGSNDIVHCPSCKARQRQTSWDTYMSYGERYYTDGKKIDAAPDYPYYIKCRECGIFFKTENCVTKGKEGFRTNYGDPPKTEFLDVDGYRAAIAEGLFNAEQEGSEVWKKDILNLRLELWWKFNDRIRDTPEITELFENDDEEKAYFDNCRELLRLSEEITGDKNYLRRAELWRNIGEFDKCRRMLSDIKDIENYAAYIGVITKMCENMNTRTARIDAP